MRRSMPVDLMLPAAEKITLVLEGIGDDKTRNTARIASPKPEALTVCSRGRCFVEALFGGDPKRFHRCQ